MKENALAGSASDEEKLNRERFYEAVKQGYGIDDGYARQCLKEILENNGYTLLDFELQEPIEDGIFLVRVHDDRAIDRKPGIPEKK